MGLELPLRDSANYREAISLFSKCIGIDSLNAKAHYAMAQCYDSLKEFEHARKEYETARDYDGLRYGRRANSAILYATF